MSEEPDAARKRAGVGDVLIGASFLVGGLALLIAMACDAAAVVGRHIGAPLLGSIEIVQACIVVIASSAMIAATISHAHAGVHILRERLRGAPRALLERFSDLASAVFFIALIAGSAWLVWDMRDGQEQTEVLRLPLAPLRMIWCACALIVCAVFLWRALFGVRREPEA